MSNKQKKTYSVDESVDDWLEEFSEEVGSNKSEVMCRAVKVYATKIRKGTWVDPKFKDKYDENMEDMT